MKQIWLLGIILSLGLSCNSEEDEAVSKTVTVVVIDKVNDSAIDSVEVMLTSIVDDRDIYNKIEYTDSLGMCTFSIEIEPSTQYSINAQKRGYWTYLEKDSTSISTLDMWIDENSEEDLIVYLTSDSLHHRDYWDNKMTRYDMDTLIALLRTEQYQGWIPKLEWIDIPQLLAVGNDTTMVGHIPSNPIACSALEETNLGFIMLWFIESIRITERDDIIYPLQRYPSFTPTIHYTNTDISMSNAEILQKTFDAYSIWWELVKDMDSKEASNSNPLENSDISWD